MRKYSVCWIGNAGWIIQPDSYYLLIDPDIEQSPMRKSLAGIPDDCIEKADWVLITHEHGDHFNLPTAKRLLNESNCRFILPESCMEAAASISIPAERIITAYHDKKISLSDDGLSVTPLPAIHGGFNGAVYMNYKAADCGYLITAMGLNLLHPGDSVLLERHFNLPPVDILMVSPTEHNTHIQHSLTLINKLKPRYIFPQHRDTYHETNDNYFWTHAFDKELSEALDAEYKMRYHVLEQGQKFIISMT